MFTKGGESDWSHLVALGAKMVVAICFARSSSSVWQDVSDIVSGSVSETCSPNRDLQSAFSGLATSRCPVFQCTRYPFRWRKQPKGHRIRSAMWRTSCPAQPGDLLEVESG